jgi:signal transduction histidine kinase
LSNDVVNVIYEDSAGTVWVGTDGGLNQFDRGQERWHVWPTDPAAPRAARIESIGSILQDSGGTLWVGAWGDGLKRLDREIGQFVPYRHASDDPKSLKTNFVTSIFEDSAGRLWVGTDGGLHRFESAEDGFRHYGEAQGFPGDFVGAMAEDAEGDLWIGTSFGLTRFDPGAGVFKNYDIEYGLHGGSYGAVAWRRSNGEMLFGGADGVVVFSPGQIQSNAYVPPVRLTALRQNGADVVLDQALENATALTFSGTQRDFEFDFAALSYVQPEGNRHAYMLEGYDQAWNYIGTNRTGRYTSLPGGNYTLRLKGANNDGVWNEEGTALTVTIVPPFWATWWFRGAVVLTLIGGVFVGYRLRVRSIETRSRELEQLVEARTFELSSTNERLAREIAERERAEQALAQQAADAAVSAERSRLARELHDAVTQTLFSANLLAEALPEIWEMDQEEGRQLLRELQQLGRGALAEMRTLLLELRPAVLMDVHLGDLLRQLAEAVTGRTGVPVEVTIEGDGKPGQRTPALPAEVHIALYRIAQEALNNVVKHAGASQMSVRMHCSACDTGPGKPRRQRVELSVCDNGTGFDPDRVPADCLGLGIIRERADAIGADLQIDSRPGEGTQVTVLWEGE